MGPTRAQPRAGQVAPGPGPARVGRAAAGPRRRLAEERLQAARESVEERPAAAGGGRSDREFGRPIVLARLPVAGRSECQSRWCVGPDTVLAESTGWAPGGVSHLRPPPPRP